jgi:hypothetical protein
MTVQLSLSFARRDDDSAVRSRGTTRASYRLAAGRREQGGGYG